ncbi:MAG: recombination protein RmuC [Actinomycetota bacterium]|jgi:DNA recombination protein RmuC|nr:recombination protein RmuC [Actinomycetota bacterium]
MVDRMVLAIGIIVLCVLSCAIGGVLAAVAVARRSVPQPEPASGPDPLAPLAEQVARLADEQRHAHDETLSRLLETNRALLEQERVRAGSELDGKKSLIDQQLVTMTGELDKVSELVRTLDGGQRKAYGELSNELRRQHEGLTALSEHTQQLREALASSKARGQWGERMAEDVLRLAGLLEGVNYRKQATLGNAGRPDYTFMMPNGRVMHMDVKFPLDNYVRHLEANNEIERKQFRDQFLRDVRDRVRELNQRGYLDATDETVDCLLMFIPNEQVYAFVHEHDRSILDDAMRNKIVVCSPLTLYAVLAVVRQAVDNFQLERTSSEILALLGEFSRQWEKYAAQLEKVQQRFEQVGKEYSSLMTTRHRALQRPLDKIEHLRHEERGLLDADIAPLTFPELSAG